MKRFVSLAIALVMSLSLTSAAAKGFTDESSIKYSEAVSVISAIEVIDGYVDGSFVPYYPLTRQAAAKIICNLILGRTTADALTIDTAPFADVSVNNQFAGYIAYCANKGIISGYADGTFRPTGTLTGYAFMKMLLGALGYDAELEGFVGPNWSINVAKLALNIGLDKGNDEFAGTAPVTREEACLYAFNALQSDMVDYDSKTSIVVNGATVNVGNDKAKSVTWSNSSTNDGSIKNDGYIQFAEQYFNKLKKTAVADEAFARPATTWTYKGTKIGTFADAPKIAYTDSAKLNEIYADLGMTTADEDFKLYVNGILVNTNKYAIKKTDDTKLSAIDSRIGKGTNIEVFYDDDTNNVTICAISVYAGKVIEVKDATSKKDAYVIIEPSTNAPKGFTSDGHDEYETSEYNEDDIVAYTYSDKDEEIGSVYLMKSTSGALTRRVESKSLTIDGTVYEYGYNYGFDGFNESDLSNKGDYTIYFDNNGYVLYVAEDDVKLENYALVLSLRGESSWNDNEARLLFADGTKKTVTTTKDYTGTIAANDIVTFKLDKNDYKLTKVSSVKNSPEAGFSISRSNKTITGIAGVQADSKTIFVIEDDENYDVYTGIKKAPELSGYTGYAYVKDGTAKIIWAIATNTSTITNSSKELIFIAAATAPRLTAATDSEDYYVYNAVVDGTITTVMIGKNVKVTDSINTFAAGDKSVNNNVIINKTSTDSDDIITKASFSSADILLRDVTGIKKVSSEEVKLGGSTYGFARGANVYFIDEDGNIEDIGINGVKTNSNNYVIYTLEDGEVTNLFIQEMAS